MLARCLLLTVSSVSALSPADANPLFSSTFSLIFGLLSRTGIEEGDFLLVFRSG